MGKQQDVAQASSAPPPSARPRRKPRRALRTRHGVRYVTTPLLRDGQNHLSYCSLTRQFATQNVLSQSFQAAEVVVLDIGSGLTQLFCNLRKCVTFHES